MTKISNALLFFVLFAISSCKKEETKEYIKPAPVASITFGYEWGSVYKSWKNYHEASVDSIKSFEHFVVSVTESNLSSLSGFTMDSGIIQIEITSKNDAETFNIRENVNSRSLFYYKFGNSIEFGSVMDLPYKISAVAVKGNDTLEIDDAGDLVRASYASRYTGLLAKDSMAVRP